MNDFIGSAAVHFDPRRFYHPHSAEVRPTVAVSACLSGQPVRYDGKDKALAAINVLMDSLTLLPICPEVGAGFGVPRPPVQLVMADTYSTPRALGRDDRTLDATARLQNFAQQSLTQLSEQRTLCGYLWKSRSPSCGLRSTPIFNADGKELGRGSGIQADYFQRERPWLSHCEETLLSDRPAALAFTLRCRIVFDVMYGGDCPLHTLHAHYRFLTNKLSDDVRPMLDALAHANNKKNYLSALHAAMAQLSAGQLLRLFNAQAPLNA